MAIALSAVTTPEQAPDPLTCVESVTIKQAGKPRKLAVCKTSTGELVLAFERERGVIDPATKKRDVKKGVERDWRRTSRLVDIAAAVKSGMLTI